MNDWAHPKSAGCAVGYGGKTSQFIVKLRTCKGRKRLCNSYLLTAIVVTSGHGRISQGSAGKTQNWNTHSDGLGGRFEASFQ